MRGYYEIGIYHGKRTENIGTLWRSAYQLGAAGIFTIGARHHQQASDTLKAWRHIPLRVYDTFDQFLSGRPYTARLIGVEMGGAPLATFQHPPRAIYLLGAEDHGLPDAIIMKCQAVVCIEAVRTASYNVAVAGSVVMYHRWLQMASSSVEDLSHAEARGSGAVCG